MTNEEIISELQQLNERWNRAYERWYRISDTEALKENDRLRAFHYAACIAAFNADVKDLVEKITVEKD